MILFIKWLYWSLTEDSYNFRKALYAFKHKDKLSEITKSNKTFVEIAKDGLEWYETLPKTDQYYLNGHSIRWTAILQKFK